MRRVEKLRSWQVEAFQLGRPAQLCVQQAPGGSGKSLLQVMLAQADIEDSGNKQLILVPRNHIHHGFFDDDCIEFTPHRRLVRCGWRFLPAAQMGFTVFLGCSTFFSSRA